MCDYISQGAFLYFTDDIFGLLNQFRNILIFDQIYKKKYRHVWRTLRCMIDIRAL